MRLIRIILFVSLLMGIAVSAFVYSGLYPMGADTPHNQLTYQILETLRERSIVRAAENIVVPDLNNPEWLLAGGPDYNDMCSSCHLQPGKTETDMSIGLYPAPPDLTRKTNTGDVSESARRHFWIIKHGIKASGMPAWGSTHDDKRIWAMVAFIRKLPELSNVQYQILTARGDDTSSHH